MMRYLRGMVLLGFVALAGACNTEPDVVAGGTPTKFLVDPGVVFVQLGDSAAVSVQLVDQQGTAFNAPITISNVGAGITVAADSSYRPIFDADGNLVFNKFGTELRLFVTATGLAASSFDVSAEGVTGTVNVTVLPVTLDATFSNLTPDVGELITVTAPAGFVFNSNSTITFAAGEDAQIVDVAADGSTISFYQVPGSSGDVTITDVTPSYAPSLKLPFTLSTTLSQTSTSLVSTDDPNTAPSFDVPAVGDTLVFYDNAYATDQYIHFTTTDANTIIEFEVDWDGGADIDVLVCDATCGAFVPGGTAGATGAHPESFAITFAAAGTYTLWNNVYSGSPPNFYKMTVTRTQ